MVRLAVRRSRVLEQAQDPGLMRRLRFVRVIEKFVALLLCEAGADKDEARPGGDTAVMRAPRRGHREVARLGHTSRSFAQVIRCSAQAAHICTHEAGVC